MELHFWQENSPKMYLCYRLIHDIQALGIICGHSIISLHSLFNIIICMAQGKRKEWCKHHPLLVWVINSRESCSLNSRQQLKSLLSLSFSRDSKTGNEFTQKLQSTCKVKPPLNLIYAIMLGYWKKRRGRSWKKERTATTSATAVEAIHRCY